MKEHHQKQKLIQGMETCVPLKSFPEVVQDNTNFFSLEHLTSIFFNKYRIKPPLKKKPGSVHEQYIKNKYLAEPNENETNKQIIMI